MSIALSLLTSMNSGSTTSSLLTALYGGTTTSSSVDPTVALKNAETNQTKGIAAAAKQPLTQRDIAAFKAALAKAPDAKTLLANPTALKVLLTANGLGDQAAYPALASKALLSDTTKSDSLASKLSNTNWLSVAKTFDFANKGLTVLKASVDTIASGYAEVQWRKSLDDSTPGLSNALDFRSRASTITSALQVLGDSTFRTVLTTALGIPKEIAYQSLEAQEKAITDRIDLTKFKKADFVEQFAKRYLVAAGTAASTTSTSSGLLV